MTSIAQYLERLPAHERKIIEGLPDDFQWLALAGRGELEKRRAQTLHRAQVDQVADRRDAGTATGADLSPVQFTPAPREYVTPLDLAAELIRRKLAIVAQAESIWRAHNSRQGGAGEVQTREGAIAILTAGGMARRTAERALSAGVGLVWDISQDGKDRRVKWYHRNEPARIIVRLNEDMPDDRPLLTGPGKWAALPLAAYRGTSGAFTAHVIGAWLMAHPESSRKQQAETFGLTPRQIQRAQHASTTKQTPRIVIARKPRQNHEAENLELSARLTTVDGERRHFWRLPGGHYAWQTTNYYHDAPARVVGWRRSKRIKARIKALCPVAREPGPLADLDFPRRFDGPDSTARADKWQQRHVTRGACILRDNPAVPLEYDYRYSVATQQGIVS